VCKFGVDIFGFGWKPLQVEKHDNSCLIQIASCRSTGLTKGAVKEQKNEFFLRDGVSDPKVVIIHDHHKVPLLCPHGNDLAIRVSTSCSTLGWNTLWN
jgi:hypothetical protein